MADHTNQHFVPQFYFRHFSPDDGRMIGTLLTQTGRTIPRASIKGQCARKNFYGSKELEVLFSQIEGQHCAAIRAALDVANNAPGPDFSPEELYYFFQAIMFQRGRTALEIDKAAPAVGKMMLEMFKRYLQHSGEDGKDEMVREIDAGNVVVTENPAATVGRSVSIALENTLGIFDLHLCLIRNRTDYPFIFSDAPVVFYNSYCRNVRNRGVIGMQCPGLQIFYPLDSWTLAFLFDAEKYSGSFRGRLQYDLHDRGDVSQLNALQLHHSLNTVYFGDPLHEQYVQDLWHTHRSGLRPLQDRFVVGADLWVDGKPPEGDLMQLFEPQLEFDLALSFVDCKPVAQADYVFSPRNREIWNELREREQSSERTSNREKGHSPSQRPALGRARVRKERDKAKSSHMLLPDSSVSEKVGRNDACPCQSGKKFKHCCQQSQ